MSRENAVTNGRPLTSTGVEGLDDILGGGLTRDRLYLLEGNPGAGKTTLALQYLLHGAASGEAGVYVTLSETKAELIAVADSHGWSLDSIHIIDLVASEEELDPDNQFAMFQPSEVELGSTTKAILREIERVKPKRVVIDSLSEVRLLAQGSLRYRRQILALKQYFIGRNCTVLLLDDLTSEASDLHLQSIAHGVLSLEQLAPEFGAERRRLRVAKLRGQRYRGGYHDFLIEPGGLRIFPRMVAAEHEGVPKDGQLKSGIDGLDALVGGGFEHGTSVLVAGPAGIGKSSLALCTPRPRPTGAAAQRSSRSRSARRRSSAGRSGSAWTFDRRSKRDASPSSRSTRASSRPANSPTPSEARRRVGAAFRRPTSSSSIASTATSTPCRRSDSS